MPYILPVERSQYDDWIDNLADTLNLLAKEMKAGNLNYIVSTLIDKMRAKRYNDMNSIIGALECVKLEYYRRIVVPHENKKIKENGDVYC